MGLVGATGHITSLCCEYCRKKRMYKKTTVITIDFLSRTFILLLFLNIFFHTFYMFIRNGVFWFYQMAGLMWTERCDEVGWEGG